MLSRRLGLFVSILSCTLAYYTQPIEVAQISPSLMAVVPGVFTINYNINSTATVSFTVPFSSSPQMLVNLQNMMYKPDTYWVSIDILQVRPASATLSFINSGSGFISFQVKFNVFASLSPQISITVTQVFNSDSVTRNLSFVQSYTPSKLPVLLDCYSDAAKTKPLPVDVFLSVSGYRAIGVINLNLSLSSSTPNQVMSINSTFSVLLQVALTPLGTMSQLTFGILAYCSQSPSFKDKYYAWIFNYKLTGSDYVIIQKNDFIKPLSIAFGLLVFGLRAQTRRLVEMAYEPVTNFQQVTTSNSTVETLKYQVGGDVDYTYLHFSAIYCYPGLLIAYNLTVPFCYTNLSCNTSLYQTYNVTYSNSTCQVSCPLKTYYTTRYGGACLNCTDYGQLCLACNNVTCLECANGLLIFHSICVCPNNLVLNGSICVCPNNLVLNGSICVCPNNLVLNGSICVCPNNLVLNGSICVCPNNLVLNNSICICPSNMMMGNNSMCLSSEPLPTVNSSMICAFNEFSFRGICSPCDSIYPYCKFCNKYGCLQCVSNWSLASGFCWCQLPFNIDPVTSVCILNQQIVSRSTPPNYQELNWNVTLLQIGFKFYFYFWLFDSVSSSDRIFNPKIFQVNQMNSSLSPTEQLSSPFGIIWQVIVLNKESPFELSIAEMVILTSNKEVEIIIFPTLPTALVSLSRITITFLGYLFIFALVTHLTALSDNLRLWFLLSSYYFMTQLNLHAIGPVLVTIAEQQAWNWGISTLIYSLITPLQTFCNRCTSVLLRKQVIKQDCFLIQITQLCALMLLCIVTGKYLSIYCKQKLSRGGNLNRLVYFCDGSLKEYAYSNLKTLSFMLLLLSIRKINELGLLLSLSYELTAAAVIEFVISCILVLGCCVLLAVQERMFKSEQGRYRTVNDRVLLDSAQSKWAQRYHTLSPVLFLLVGEFSINNESILRGYIQRGLLLVLVLTDLIATAIIKQKFTSQFYFWCRVIGLAIFIVFQIALEISLAFNLIVCWIIVSALIILFGGFIIVEFTLKLLTVICETNSSPEFSITCQSITDSMSEVTTDILSDLTQTVSATNTILAK